MADNGSSVSLSPSHSTAEAASDESQKSDTEDCDEEKEDTERKLHYPWTPMILLMVVTVGQRLFPTLCKK